MTAIGSVQITIVAHLIVVDVTSAAETARTLLSSCEAVVTMRRTTSCRTVKSCFAGIDHRIEPGVPLPYRAPECEHRQNWRGQRQQNLENNPRRRRAVDHRALLQLIRQFLDEKSRQMTRFHAEVTTRKQPCPTRIEQPQVPAYSGMSEIRPALMNIVSTM